MDDAVVRDFSGVSFLPPAHDALSALAVFPSQNCFDAAAVQVFVGLSNGEFTT
ncbi:hypothetical protein PC116_g21293 [Phytophthora cactorum]|nr:hypothetical protein PC116_g21293 [Phytophthora cactorum]